MITAFKNQYMIGYKFYLRKNFADGPFKMAG